MPSRACSFCLGLREGSVFADFGVDDVGIVRLMRISFDGYGCCNDEFKKMNEDDSRLLVKAVNADMFEGAEIEGALRRYFRENADLIWRDALVDHELL